VAFGVRDANRGTERLVVAAESAAATPQERDRVIAGVDRAVVDAIGERADEVRLIPIGALARTPNRKLRRSRARELYVSGRLEDRGSPVGLQMFRLWRRNLGALTSMGARRMRRRAASALSLACARALASAGFSHGSSASRVLRLLGRSVSLKSELPVGTLLAANRCGPYDALAILAAAKTEVRFAGDEALHGVPEWLWPSIEQYVVRGEEEIRAALSRGSVVQFPDSAAGADPLRCRFRLKPLSVASRVAPLALHEIQNQTRIVAGDPVQAAGSPTELRNRIRMALAALYA
jgi:hypothetical protein